MGKFIHLFKTEAEYETKRETGYTEPWVSYTRETSAVTYDKTEYEKLLEKPLTLMADDEGEIIWKFAIEDEPGEKTIEYSKNGGEWISITSTAEGVSIPVTRGDKVQFRGDNETYFDDVSGNYNHFSSTCAFSIEGNIMSLVNSTGFATATTLVSADTFSDLFAYCDVLDYSELLLPATTLAGWCYHGMFRGTNVIVKKAPALPATTLAEGCYNGMFADTNLTQAPELPATTLAIGCYESMFQGCTGLTSAPELPATTLANNCYKSMFSGCTGLTIAPELPATTLANNCYQGMFSRCTSLTSAPELPATTLAIGCYNSMFSGCRSLTSAPELPATTLANYCYSNMFQNCTNLNYIKCLATNISASNCTGNWVNGVSATGTFVKNANMSSWTTGANGIPTNWTVQDA